MLIHREEELDVERNESRVIQTEASKGERRGKIMRTGMSGRRAKEGVCTRR